VDSLLEQQKLPTGTAPPGKRSKHVESVVRTAINGYRTETAASG